MDFIQKEFIYHSILYDYETTYGKTDKQSDRIEIDDITPAELKQRIG